MLYLAPANEVCEGCVSTGVCLSTGDGMHGKGRVWQEGMRGRGGGCAWQGGVHDTGAHAWHGGMRGRGMATAAGGTHPTEMHSF